MNEWWNSFQSFCWFFICIPPESRFSSPSKRGTTFRWFQSFFCSSHIQHIKKKSGDDKRIIVWAVEEEKKTEKKVLTKIFGELSLSSLRERNSSSRRRRNQLSSEKTVKIGIWLTNATTSHWNETLCVVFDSHLARVVLRWCVLNPYKFHFSLKREGEMVARICEFETSQIWSVCSQFHNCIIREFELDCNFATPSNRLIISLPPTFNSHY